ncbi:MAG: prepilin-type N-terminal cleavage/methylation domain-containing protein [Burkholderiales bacterium]|nr:prepilin-type N-terminal cleavage/methylation domain-containing protein [Burkholderiales bacterium]
MKARQTGFTLVEIAIVLVIIGLLLGGILKGQEMITQAKIKNVVNDFNGITAAVNSYQDRYRSLPGDDQTADTRWSGAVKGNGDGVFGVASTTTYTVYNKVLAAAPTTTDESNSFWWHLRLAGFVGGATTGAAAGQQPANAANGIMGVQTTGLGFTSNIVCSSNLPDKIAIAVDTQMDDSTAASGQVRATLQTGPNPTVPATTTADVYAETGTNQYLLCKNM